MYDSDKITLDRETFRALAVDSRVDILKSLEERKLTLTDLSTRLNMSPSTVKEHLDRLVSAGLIENIPGDTKWKYYKLTWKGKNILNPHETKVWFILAVSLVSLIALTYRIFGKITDLNRYIGQKAAESIHEGGVLMMSDEMENATRLAGDSLKEVPRALASTTTLAETLTKKAFETSGALTTLQPAELALALLLMLSAGVCIGLLLKRRGVF
jgi:DNA-binding transcriptional ArsR family regulator